MTKKDVIDGIERQATTDIRIAGELADIVEFLIVNGYTPNGDAVKTPDLKSGCPQASYYRVERLHNEMGLVLKFKQGPSTYLIHTRLGGVVNGQNVSAMINEELSRLADHAKRDSRVRRVIANKRGVSPGKALNGLAQGGFVQRRERLDRLVSAVQNHPAVSQGKYGKIIFRTPANLYRASSLAVQLWNK